MDNTKQMGRVVPLEFLTAGERGRVIDIAGRAELVDRLAEMGLRIDAEIRMVRPGSPCIVAVANGRMSFRGDEAARILIEVPQP